MKFQKILDKIFSWDEMKLSPPVLVDIGASENVHKLWRKIAKYSICIAFDADAREMNYIEKVTKDFKKLFVFNCIVSDQQKEEIDFYLTKSPYCSSTLQPDINKLKVWSFAEKFDVLRKDKVKVKNLPTILNELKLNRIDWYKSDSQGVDLRIFKTLDVSIKNRIITAEFEPGFIDSYIGEDKLSQLISFFEKENFWISNMKVKGSQRITKEHLSHCYNSEILNKLAQFSHTVSPGWAEIIYINSFEGEFNLRDYVLGWVSSTILNQHGFSLALIEKALIKFPDSKINYLLLQMKKYSVKRIKRNVFLLKFFPSAIEKISKLLKIA